MKFKKELMVGAFLCCITHTANAYIMTFEDRIIDRLDLAGLQAEGDFSYLAMGAAWEVSATRGNPPSALVTFGSGPVPEETPVIGDFVDIFLNDGDLFSFSSVDFATALARPTSNSDDVTIFGLLDGIQVDALNLFDSSIAYLTVDSGFTNSIDRLRVEIAGSWMSDGMILDNFNLTPLEISEPPIIALLGLGLLGSWWSRKKQV